jgi:diguanylate cyclase
LPIAQQLRRYKNGMTLRIKTKREVRTFTAMITAFAVMIPVVISWTVLRFSPENFSDNIIISAIIIAGIIPLLVAPPIAYVVLNMIRVQEEMIRTVDARIKFDMMTGLLNRNHFLDSVRASQQSGPIMIIDADHFKAINDNYGHAVGDETLRILANAVTGCMGTHGIVGRLGGEEFGIFMPGKSKVEGRVMAESICGAIRELHPMVEGKKLKLSVSIGCTYHRATAIIGHSLQVADKLLYRAKAEGRDRAVHDSPAEKLRQSA